MPSLKETVSSGLHLRRGVSKPYEQKLQAGEYLDSEDQEELVEDLHSQSQFLNAIWRGILVVFGFFLIVVNVWMILSLLLQGHTFVYFNRVLFPALGKAKLLILEITSLLAFSASLAHAIRIPTHHDLPLITSVVASGVSILLYVVFTLMSPLTFKECYIPLINAFYAVLCVYVDKSAQSFQVQMSELDKLRYKLSTA